jgi:hypothetical protein
MIASERWRTQASRQATRQATRRGNQRATLALARRPRSPVTCFFLAISWTNETSRAFASPMIPSELPSYPAQRGNDALALALAVNARRGRPRPQLSPSTRAVVAVPVVALAAASRSHSLSLNRQPAPWPSRSAARSSPGYTDMTRLRQTTKAVSSKFKRSNRPDCQTVGASFKLDFIGCRTTLP